MTGEASLVKADTSAADDHSNPWRIISDLIDDCIGVKGRPQRLITYANIFLTALAGCVVLMWSMIPESIQQGERLPLSAFSFGSGENVLHLNAQVLASNVWIIRYALVAFAVCIIVLAGLITTIGRAIIQDEYRRAKKI